MSNSFNNLWDSKQRPSIIAGPCSAESKEQLYEVCKDLYDGGVTTIRAGIWKPRTRPNSFEGIGLPALKWISEIKEQLPVAFAIEVATADHVALALEAGVDILWLGARTTVNPFTVQEIADSLAGVDVPVLIKNPINPDLALWIGAVERIANVGVKRIGAIHRGFSSHRKSEFRNEPIWQIPIDFRRELPHIPLLCDPSHIAGHRGYIAQISQRALDLNYDGLMIEVHPNPDEALSDPLQQITPAALVGLMNNLQVRSTSSTDAMFISKLEELRDKIDQVDSELVTLLKHRMAIVDEIGHYKKENNVAIFQLERWNEILKSRGDWAERGNLDREFIEKIYKAIHEESLKQQTSISKMPNDE